MDKKEECASASKEHINRYKMAHMIGVAEYMRERAKDYGVSPDIMYTVGLLHDIGYLQGREGHESYGALLLTAIGVNEIVSNAIEFHGKNPYEIRDFYGEEGITPVYMLLLEADMSVDARGYRVGFEKRLDDIGRRYGYNHIAYITAQDNIKFVKEYQSEHGIGKPVRLYHKEHKEHKDEGNER